MIGFEDRDSNGQPTAPASDVTNGKESNEPDFDVEEPSYQEMLHGNLRRMSSTVREECAHVGSRTQSHKKISELSSNSTLAFNQSEQLK